MSNRPLAVVLLEVVSVPPNAVKLDMSEGVLLGVAGIDDGAIAIHARAGNLDQLLLDIHPGTFAAAVLPAAAAPVKSSVAPLSTITGPPVPEPSAKKLPILTVPAAISVVPE